MKWDLPQFQLDPETDLFSLTFSHLNGIETEKNHNDDDDSDSNAMF